MQNVLTDEQKADATARLEEVKKFMIDKEVDIMAYPNHVYLATNPQGLPIFGTTCEVKFVDTKYAPKGDAPIPSPFV